MAGQAKRLTPTDPIQGPAAPSETIETSYFDPEPLRKIAESGRNSFRSARPFPHIVMDDFVEEAALDRVLAEFPKPPPSPRGGLELKKSTVASEVEFEPFTRHFLAQFNSSVFLDFLERLTGIPGLIPDPHYLGGGLHQTEAGGFLKIHADFNRHRHLKLDRRLNLILFLNRGWEEEYGGHLEFWNRDMTRCEERVLPIFNRCVVFSTTDFSYHGHPEPLSCPREVTRKSLALYYYSNGRPLHEMSSAHTTLFKARPGESMHRPAGYRAKVIARRLVPPILVDALQAVRARRGPSASRGKD